MNILLGITSIQISSPERIPRPVWACMTKMATNIVRFSVYDSDANSIESIKAKGQIKPRLQGWHSKNGRELEENTAIGFPLSGKSCFAVTVFDFKMENTGIPYLRIGTNGKYLRFSLVQGKKKIDVRLRTDAAGKSTAEVEVDDRLWMCQLSQ